MDHIDVGTLQEALHLSGVGVLSRSGTVSVSQLRSSVTELYSCLRVLRPVLGSAQIQQTEELCSNWLQMNYQCSTGGKVDAGSLKITLCLLTGAKPQDKARCKHEDKPDIYLHCPAVTELAEPSSLSPFD